MVNIPTIDKSRLGTWAIVTGASSGIGKEFARQLAHNGFNLVLVARRQNLLEELADTLTKTFNIQVRIKAIDVTKSDMLQQIDAICNDIKVGLLISNAGTGNPGHFFDIEYKQLEYIIHLNVFAHLKLTHHFGRQMAKRGQGGIILVSAMGAMTGIPYMANDAATKAYMISLGKGLHSEFSPLGLKISVLLPGPTQTAIIDKFGFKAETMPMKPMSVEQCVAEGLTALVANKSTHLTGRLNRIMNVIVPERVLRSMMGKMIAQGITQQQTQLQTEGA